MLITVAQCIALFWMTQRFLIEWSIVRKLFRLLLKRQLTAVILRMLAYTICTSVMSHAWIGMVFVRLCLVCSMALSKEALLAQYCFVSILMI